MTRAVKRHQTISLLFGEGIVFPEKQLLNKMMQKLILQILLVTIDGWRPLKPSPSAPSPSHPLFEKYYYFLLVQVRLCNGQYGPVGLGQGQYRALQVQKAPKGIKIRKNSSYQHFSSNQNIFIIFGVEGGGDNFFFGSSPLKQFNHQQNILISYSINIHNLAKKCFSLTYLF